MPGGRGVTAAEGAPKGEPGSRRIKPMPRSWTVSLMILTVCLLASIVIAAIKL